MVLEKIKPFGYCNGVNVAIKKLSRIIKTNPNNQIHLIGWIVHNKQINEELLLNKNVFLHEGLDKKVIVKKILKKTNNKNKLIFVFSTHGTDPQAIKEVKKYNCQYHNFVCPYIKLIISKIEKAIEKGYKVYFFGKKNHHETLCIKHTYKKVKVYAKKEDVNQDDFYKKYVICQTTANYQNFFATKKWFKNAIFEETICNFCKAKQKQAMQLKTSNSIIVISDKKSNNGLIIFKILKQRNKYVYFLSPNRKTILKIKKTPKIYVFTSSSISQEQANMILKNHLNKLQ